MPIRLDSLLAVGTRFKRPAIHDLAEAKGLNLQTAFLCHSNKDEKLGSRAFRRF